MYELNFFHLGWRGLVIIKPRVIVFPEIPIENVWETLGRQLV